MTIIGYRLHELDSIDIKRERNNYALGRKDHNQGDMHCRRICTWRDERRMTSTQTKNDTKRKMQTSCQSSRQRSKSSQRGRKMLTTCRYKVTTRALKRQGRNINNHDQSQHRIQLKFVQEATTSLLSDSEFIWYVRFSLRERFIRSRSWRSLYATSVRLDDQCVWARAIDVSFGPGSSRGQPLRRGGARKLSAT